MQRRSFLQGLAALAAGGTTASTLTAGNVMAAQATVHPKVEEMQKNWRSFLPEGLKPPAPGDALKLSNAEWKKRLPAAAYAVLREEDTERAGSSPLNQEKRPGIFACAGCDLPLFTSDMKYESGTGWPSFFTTIPGVFGTKKDYYLFMPRVEYHCIRCGGHHGHVFDDGPPPTNQRWCNNGLALKFIPKTGKA